MYPLRIWGMDAPPFLQALERRQWPFRSLYITFLLTRFLLSVDCRNCRGTFQVLKTQLLGANP